MSVSYKPSRTMNSASTFEIALPHPFEKSAIRNTQRTRMKRYADNIAQTNVRKSVLATISIAYMLRVSRLCKTLNA